MATVDVIANRSTASEILGKAYFETDTNSFIVYNGYGWVELQSDGTGAAAPFSQYSVDFDGTDDYVDVGDVTALNSATNASYSFWYNWSTQGTVCSLLGDVSKGLEVYHHSNTLYAHNFIDGNTYLSVSRPSTGTWYHVVCTFNSSASKLYLNGSLVDSGSGASATASNCGNSFQIARLSGSNLLGGAKLIDEVALFTSTLSASDVTAIYNSGVPTDLTSYSPVAWWRMGDNDGGTGTTITDQGSGSNNGTLTNGPTFSTDVPS